MISVADATTSTWIEGIGNEVLTTVAIFTTFAAICLAWYSTRLTVNQVRLTTVRVRRHDVRLNRVQDSSTEEFRSAAQNDTNSQRENQPQQGGVITDAVQATPDATTSSSPQPPTADTESEDDGPAEELTAAAGRADTPDPVPDGPSQQPEAGTEPSASQQEPSGDQSPPPAPSGAESNQGAEETDSANNVSASGSRDTASAQPSGEWVATEPRESPPPQSPPTDSQSDGAETPTTTDSISLRLRFLNEDERVVIVRRTDTIQTIKRANFTPELANNRVVRFIYNGQELKDTQTLRSYNIADQAVIHTLITEPRVPNAPPHTHPPDDAVAFNAGALMVPLFVVVLAIIWYLRLEYGQFFTLTSTISLMCISIVFAFGLVAQRYPAQTTARRSNHTIDVNMNHGVRASA